MVGRRISVYWPEDKEWYDGKLEKYDKARDKYNITYDDGEKEVITLEKEEWKEAGPKKASKKKRESDSDSSSEDSSSEEEDEEVLDDDSEDDDYNVKSSDMVEDDGGDFYRHFLAETQATPYEPYEPTSDHDRTCGCKVEPKP